MNKEQLASVSDAIFKLQRIDIDGIANAVYRGADFRDIRVGTYSIDYTIRRFSEVIELLSNAIEKGAWKSLPFTARRDKSIKLDNQLNLLLEKIEQGLFFDNWLEQLLWLIQYESDNALWTNTSKQKKSHIYVSDVSSLSKQLKAQLAEAKAIKKQIAAVQKETAQIRAQQESDFEHIRLIQSRIEQSGEAVRKTEIDSVRYIAGLKSTSEYMTTYAESIQRSIEQDRQRATEFESNSAKMQGHFEAAVGNVSTIQEAFDAVLANAKEKEKHILDQEKAIAELRGFAADGALGGVFNRRSKQLNITVWFWTLASMVVAYIAGNWILEIVKANPLHDLKDGSIDWGVLLTNTLRSLPALILAYFCLAQYTRERNVQEEYAFKAAVSMSITAYAAMIGIDEKRTKMLVATVQGVYTPPSLGKPFKPFSFRTKDMAELSKNLVEATKNVQLMTSDALKSKQSSDDGKSEK